MTLLFQLMSIYRFLRRRWKNSLENDRRKKELLEDTRERVHAIYTERKQRYTYNITAQKYS